MRCDVTYLMVLDCVSDIADACEHVLYSAALALPLALPLACRTAYPRSTLEPDNASVQKYKDTFLAKNKRQKVEA